MIHLIGLGLDDKELTEKSLEALKKSDIAYAEFYTNTKTIDLDRLEEKTGTEISSVERQDVEQKDIIIEEGKEKEVAFLVSGDPLTATTHYDIKQRAEKEDIKINTYHAPSILTSISETGLNIYKFGRTVTLPKHAEPESIIRQIRDNYSIGLHTLVLLDINFPAPKAARKLIKMDPDLEEKNVMVLERANNSTQQINYLKLKELEKESLGETPHCIIFVGETSHKEEENLSQFK